MNWQRNPATRSSTKLDLIAEEIRQKIVKNEYPPGTSLPTRTELEEYFQVSRVTIQRALDKLMEDGFIVAKPGSGTYVAEFPPHLCRYGVVFPYRPSEERKWMPFWTILRDAALIINENKTAPKPRKMVVYYSNRGRRDSLEYLELERDVEAHTIAGLIFVSNPLDLVDTPALSEPGIPRLAITDAEVPANIGVRIRLDAQSFLDKALDYLAAQRRRKIALLTEASGGADNAFCHYFLASVKQRGLETAPCWMQALRAADASWARNLVHLLMQGGPATRPDGLIIAHDSLVEHAKAGLIAAGAAVPHDVEVVAHCNFPALGPAVLPIQRLGYDVRQVLRLSIDCIDKMRANQKPPAVVKVPAVFEDEARLPDDDLFARAAAGSEAEPDEA
ncbi:MAG: GntR family transcriptional regulator [Planctomycetota bacterium]|nr:GntR family transcriptional regulator [Planctomycetota bacterium]